MGEAVRQVARLESADRDRVRALATEVERRDGSPPLSDRALSRLGSEQVRHFTAVQGSTLTGYAQRDGTDVEVVTDAAHVIPALLDLAEQDGPPDLRVWAHGAASPVGAALAARDYRQARVVHQLRRPGGAVPETTVLPPGITVRAFIPGLDELAWLRVNAAAFAAHPEQGGWTLDDLRTREHEPWFEPAGFLLAERHGELAGFHWTKIHADGTGEVYVLGVDPSAQGLGLGAVLLAAGLAHLAERGCPQVLLYVDESNRTATALYRRFGFTAFDVDVQWRRGLA